MIKKSLSLFGYYAVTNLQVTFRYQDAACCPLKPPLLQEFYIIPTFVKTLFVTEPRTLFFVDDDADDTFLFREILAEVDATVLFSSASNGEEAFQKLTTSTFPLPRLIFMDLNMPLMDGKQCLAAIKKTDRLKDIPVIIYTTSSYQKDKEEVMKMGAASFITKPASYHKLKEILSIVTQHLADLPKAFETLKSTSV